MIRVVIGDDHAVVREGLRRILDDRDDIEVVGEAANGREAVALVQQRKPDVVLLDISMPEKDGIDATRDIVELDDASTNVLILTMHTDEHYALRALRAGALGFVLKDAKAEEIIAAIRRVNDGERYLPADLERSFAEKYLDPEPQAVRASLSKREFEVLCLLATGLTNREIADKLAISIKTVDSHRRHILKKLNLRNNSDITRFAILHGHIQV